ncbi:conserved hypothetical protein [Ricinus communis]|uniref:Uncharacterized protein n=1 Tax=Ricinus communis TaxID=3988 RepID=B9TLA6_RICCO|nr:conserved hypothetical protein [Ricinus communis]
MPRLPGHFLLERRESDQHGRADAGTRFAHDFVAGARGRGEAFRVEDLDIAAAVVDEPLLLQGAGGLRDAHAAHAQRVGEKFVSQVEFIGLEAVARDEQRACETRLQHVVAAADGDLDGLGQQRIRVAVQHALQGRIAGKFGAQAVGVDAARAAGTLHDGAHLRRVVAERDGGAQHSLAAHEAHFERHAAFGHGHQGDQAVVRKIDVADRVARLAQHGADVHLDLVERRQHPGQLLRRKRGQQQVGIVLGDHRWSS